MINDVNNVQNLSQLIPNRITSCYGIIIDFTFPKITRKQDFYQIVSLVDPYSKNKVIKLLIFQPKIESFPNITEKGDIIFCKNVKVEQFLDKIQLISNISSIFKVFPKIKSYNDNFEDPIVDNYRNWWRENEYDNFMYNNFNYNSSYNNSNNNNNNNNFQSSTSSKRVYTISELNRSTRYFDIYGQLVRIFEPRNSSYTTVLITDYTENELLEEKVFHDNPSLHGKIYLSCIFWDQYASEIKKYSEGDYLLIKNLCLKFNSNTNTVEGVIHGSSNQKKVIFKLNNNDTEVDIIKTNKENFIKKFIGIPSSPPSPDNKRQINDHRNSQIDDSLIITDGMYKLIDSGNSLMNDNRSEMTTSTPKKNINLNNHQDLFKSSPIKIDNSNINNINNNTITKPLNITTIDHFNMPITKIKTILDSNEIPNRYRCRVRVVDYMPRKIENFTRPYCTVCKKTFEKTNDINPCCVHCKASGNKIIYAFMFSLLVEDDSKEFLPIIIFELKTSEFLGLPATSLKDPKEIQKLSLRLGKLWTFKSRDDYYILKGRKLKHTKKILNGNYFDVCIERYKNTQGIRQKVFDTRLI